MRTKTANQSLKQTGRADATIERSIFARIFWGSMSFSVSPFRQLSFSLELKETA